MEENFAEGLRCGNGIDILNGKPTGIIRVSLGATSDLGDVEKFLVFLSFFTKTHQNPREARTLFSSKSVHPVLAGNRTTQGQDKDIVSAIIKKADERIACPLAFCRMMIDSKAEKFEHYKKHTIGQSKSRWRSAFLGQYRRVALQA